MIRMMEKRGTRSLQFLAVKEVVKILFAAAERAEDNYLQELLSILQNLGLFSDVFLHSMRYLQLQYEDVRKPSAATLTSAASVDDDDAGGGVGVDENLDGIVKILLPTLLHSRLTVLDLKCEFLRCSFKAKEIVLGSIRHLSYLEKVDVTGFCSDELAVQLSLHSPHLRHLAANNSKALTDLALNALTGVLRLNSHFVPGCKKLKRLDIYNCPLISTSKIVSVLLTLPDLTFLSSDQLPQVFQSSALFESGQQFQLTNFEHVVTHLERAGEKINFHLRSEDRFLVKVNEIFLRIATVRLTLSHLYDDARTLRQLTTFAGIHTLVLEQPVGRLDDNFRQFLVEKGHQMRKLCLRVHAARLADLAAVLHFCPGLRVFQFFSTVLESSLENFVLHSAAAADVGGQPRPAWSLLPDLAEVYLGSNKLSIVEDDVVFRGGDPGIFGAFFQDCLLRVTRLRSLVLSGSCCSWLTDEILERVLAMGRFNHLRRLSVTGKASRES